MAKLGKIELIDRIQAACAENGHEFTKKDIAEIFNTTTDTIGKTLQSGDDITITGFGTFHVRKVKAHDGINPRTKEKIKIASTNRVGFTAGKPLKELVNTKAKKKSAEKVNLVKPPKKTASAEKVNLVKQPKVNLVKPPKKKKA